MIANLKIEWLEKLAKAGGTDFEDYKHRQSAHYGAMELERFTEKDVKLMVGIVQAAKTESGARSALQKLNMYLKLKADPEGIKITRLEVLAGALKNYIGKSPHKWLFTDRNDEQTVPYYVSSIEFEPFDPTHGTPASTVVRLVALVGRDKESNSIHFHSTNLGRTAVEILNKEGYYLETEEVVEGYSKEMQSYKQYYGLTGEQFSGSGYAYKNMRYYDKELVSMVRDGVPAKLVMDDEADDEERVREKTKDSVISGSFWANKIEGKRSKYDVDESDDSEDTAISIPVQPYLSMFDLDKHQFVSIHVNNIKPYVYDSTLIDKLVLPQERKDLVSILVTGADLQLEDIIRGKTGGIIVVCTGPPGTGKTLTAEVFAEEVKRPLYGVQCSQLGVTEEELEKKLKLVLERSTRWRAILLIDESDVYVHERGMDIQQNAICGVFLRVLEYYRGILFMTSNRDTIIDDAIMSRATAWIQYEYPDAAQLTAIWKVLAKQYGVELSAEQVGQLVNSRKLIGLSGRSVKNLLKLARLLSIKNKEPITVKLIEYVSQFISLDHSGKPCTQS